MAQTFIFISGYKIAKRWYAHYYMLNDGVILRGPMLSEISYALAKIPEVKLEIVKSTS